MVIINKEINREKMKGYQLLEHISKDFLTYNKRTHCKITEHTSGKWINNLFTVFPFISDAKSQLIINP